MNLSSPWSCTNSSFSHFHYWNRESGWHDSTVNGPWNPSDAEFMFRFQECSKICLQEVLLERRNDEEYRAISKHMNLQRWSCGWGWWIYTMIEVKTIAVYSPPPNFKFTMKIKGFKNNIKIVVEETGEKYIKQFFFVWKTNTHRQERLHLHGRKYGVKSFWED